ncbi:histidine phosphatase family protein [Leptolyngbya sp. AN02str]|uniref:histidine phosphatase family protein n=1 Tax=Leptolyngbya sp. AN02str TaxID=3423363 RepID=UPI003D30F6AC
MSLTLYFLRHGETTYSQTGRYCGAMNPELTEAGVQMAQAFADTYQHQTWEAVYVSPMKRTIATATPLCTAIGQTMQIRDGLKEMQYGTWEDALPGLVKTQFLDEYLNWMTEPAWNAPANGETAVQIATRAMSVIAEIEAAHTHGNVLVVSHKATIRIILCSLLGIDLGRYRDRIDMPAGAVSVVKFTKFGPMLQRMGDRAYMDDELRNREGT